jgi:hypothetical protein
MRKEQVVPALRHHPRSRRQRPRPVRNLLKDQAHPELQDLLDKLIF